MAGNNVNIVIKGDYTDKDIKRALGDLGKLQAAGMSTGAKMQAFGTQLQGIGQSVGKVGKSMTIGLTLPIVGVGVAATKMAMDFDESMTKMVSLVGLSRDEVDGMRKDIIAMASQYGKSGKEAADAMFFITSAGLRGADAMETLEASLKGAAIGLGDVQTIADLATSAMNAYGPSVLSATKATSILRTAVEQGKLESSELAGAMGSVLPVASALGVSFGEVAGIMAAMSRTGTNAAEASTQVRGIMAQLAKETPKGAKALASVGLSYEGIRKQVRDEGLLPALETLVKAFDGNAVATSAFFGNVRALTGVMDLFGGMADSTAQVVGKVSSAVEADLDPAMAAAADTVKFQLTQAFAALKNSMIQFGEVIAPIVAKIAERIAAIGNAFQNLSPQTKTFIVIAGAIVAAIGPLLLIVGKLIVVVGGAIKVLGLITAAGAILAIKVIAIVAAIALVVAAFKLAYDNSAPLRDAVSALMRALEGLGRSIVNAVLTPFKTLTGEGKDMGDIFKTLGQILGQVFAVAVTIVTNAVKTLNATFQILGKALEVTTTIVKMAASIVRGLLIVAFDVLMNKLGPISTALRNVANGVRTAFTSIANVVRGAFAGVTGAVENVINFAIKGINALIDAYNKLAQFLPGVSQATRIAEFRFTGLSGAATNAANATYNAASASGFNAREAERQGTAVAATAADLVSATNITNANTAATGGNSAAKGKNADATDKQTEKLKKYQTAFDEHVTKLKAAREQIQNAYDGMAKSVQDAIMGALNFKDAAPEFNEAGEQVGGSFIEKLTAQAERAKEFAGRVRELVTAGLSRESIAMVLAAGVEAGTNIANELIGGGEAAITETNRLVASTQFAADEIGVMAASHFFGTGLTLAKQTEDAFAKRFGPGGAGFNKLNNLMTHLAKSLDRTSTITVVTKHVSQGIPGRRMGGPVAAGSPYIVGEAGPELFVPTMTGQIIPNHDITGSMTGRGGGVSMAGGGSTINLTVNAGMGTQGAEVGRQIVDALKAYERRNGSVYVAA